MTRLAELSLQHSLVRFFGASPRHRRLRIDAFDEMHIARRCRRRELQFHRQGGIVRLLDHDTPLVARLSFDRAGQRQSLSIDHDRGSLDVRAQREALLRDRKTAQLCAQVLRTLSSAFGELADPLLRELSIHSVEPAPDASRLLVHVYFERPPSDVDVASVMTKLQAVRGFLRAEIASAINRKRTPELGFQIVVAEVGP